MPQCSQLVPASLARPEWAMTKLVSSSLMGVLPLTGRPSFWAAHCSQRCFSIFLPLLISVRWTVAGLLQLSHFMGSVASYWLLVASVIQSYLRYGSASNVTVDKPLNSLEFPR